MVLAVPKLSGLVVALRFVWLGLYRMVSVAGPNSQNHVSLSAVATPVTIAGGDV